MARSSYVYVVESNHQTRGTFTVKHEMVTAVQRALDAKTLSVVGLRIFRHQDGTLDTEVPISDQFEWRG